MFVRLVLTLMVVLNPVAGRYYCSVHQHTVTLFGLCDHVCAHLCAHAEHLAAHEHGGCHCTCAEHRHVGLCHHELASCMDDMAHGNEAEFCPACCTVERQLTPAMCVDSKDAQPKDAGAFLVTLGKVPEMPTCHFSGETRPLDDALNDFRLHLRLCVLLI